MKPTKEAIKNRKLMKKTILFNDVESDLWIGALVSLVIMISIVSIVSDIWLDLELESICLDHVGVLKSINSVTDKDSGLFSAGDTHRTTLIFEDNLVINLNYVVDKPIYIGKPMIYKECTRSDGKIKYMVGE